MSIGNCLAMSPPRRYSSSDRLAISPKLSSSDSIERPVFHCIHRLRFYRLVQYHLVFWAAQQRLHCEVNESKKRNKTKQNRMNNNRENVQYCTMHGYTLHLIFLHIMQCDTKLIYACAHFYLFLTYADAHRTMPCDSTPRILAGFKLHKTATKRFSICSIGTYFANPLTYY